MKAKIFNIIVAGTGGQGVVTLSNLIRKMAKDNNFECQGSTYKGGAQRMGTVYSELRLRPKTEKSTIFSSQIPAGKVDVLIGLEPAETLRFAFRCYEGTKVITHSIPEKLYIERMNGKLMQNVDESLKTTFSNLILEDFSTSLDEKLNICVLRNALENHYLPFDSTQLNEILERK